MTGQDEFAGPAAEATPAPGAAPPTAALHLPGNPAPPSAHAGLPSTTHPAASPSLKVGMSTQAAAAALFIVGLVMDSYSVTTYYASGATTSRHPLLVPGLLIGVIAVIAAAVGAVISRRAKAERLARLTSSPGSTVHSTKEK